MTWEIRKRRAEADFSQCRQMLHHPRRGDASTTGLGERRSSHAPQSQSLESQARLDRSGGIGPPRLCSPFFERCKLPGAGGRFSCFDRSPRPHGRATASASVWPSSRCFAPRPVARLRLLASFLARSLIFGTRRGRGLERFGFLLALRFFSLLLRGVSLSFRKSVVWLYQVADSQ